MSQPAVDTLKSASPWRAALEQARGADNDAVMMAFLEGCEAKGLELYPAQEQAVLEIMADRHVILNTPTGSGKSLVALAMKFRSLAQGKRTYYTCPIKALVSEKFFALCDDLGAEHVGMLTGDASINPDAPIVCCTAEILANRGLRYGKDAEVDYAVLDEFHYFSDPDRGMAWQVPLLTLPNTTFLLMSATLGDTSTIEKLLKSQTQRDVAVVTSHDRPVPLEFIYSDDPLHETVDELLQHNKAPIYIVCFTQREAAEQAQALTSIEVIPKHEKEQLAKRTKHFRFDSPYGKDVRRFVRHGVGVHHAGLLPKYRRLTEQLAQDGLLRVVCGTDTLGVGINVPIRTVVFTKLCKFDGEKVGILSVRDFKQIAGRAGRKGFDEEGTVVCQAPEHVIENKRLEAKISANPQKKKKIVKKKPPERNFVMWTEATFQNLQESRPEPLQSQFNVDYGVLINLLQDDAERGYRRLVQLIASSLEPSRQKTHHRRHCAVLFRSLRAAGVMSVIRNKNRGARVVINAELQRNFSLNHSLSLFLLEAIEALDPDNEAYALDLLTLTESILENPRAVLLRQRDRARDECIAKLKADGVEYEERMAQLEDVDYPKPNAEFIYQAFNAYRKVHPWLSSDAVRPKSVVREIVETCASFNQYIKDYGLQRSEGILLRYLSDTYKAFLQNVPDTAHNDDSRDILTYLRSLLRQTDSSLITEWETLLEGGELAPDSPHKPPAKEPTLSPKQLTARLRAEAHQFVGALARQDYEEALALVQPGATSWTPQSLGKAMEEYFNTYDSLDVSHRARLSDKTHLNTQDPSAVELTQTLVDPNDDNLWFARFVVDTTNLPAEGPCLQLEEIGS